MTRKDIYLNPKKHGKMRNEIGRPKCFLIGKTLEEFTCVFCGEKVKPGDDYSLCYYDDSIPSCFNCTKDGCETSDGCEDLKGQFDKIKEIEKRILKHNMKVKNEI